MNEVKAVTNYSVEQIENTMLYYGLVYVKQAIEILNQIAKPKEGKEDKE
jgi:hypothetical protein